MHRIKRVQLEFTTFEVPLAEALLARAGALHERRIAPLLGRVCSELSGPDRRDRLDRLEVDLGCVDDDDDLIRKLEVALRSALSRALHDHRGAPRTDPALELLGLFARTGNLPWWSDHADGDPIAAAIARASDTSPRELLALLRELADDPTALARLVRHDARAHITTLVADPASPASSLLAHLTRRPTRPQPGARAPASVPHLAAEPADATATSSDPRAPHADPLAVRPERPGGTAESPARIPPLAAEPAATDRIPTLSAGPASDIPGPAGPLAPGADLSSLLALRENLIVPTELPDARLLEHPSGRPTRPEPGARAPAEPAIAAIAATDRMPTLSAGPASDIRGPADPRAPDADLSSILARLHEHLTGHPARPEGSAEPLPRIPTLSAGPANTTSLHEHLARHPAPPDRHLTGHPAPPDGSAALPPRIPTLSAGPATAIPAPADPLALDADLSSLLARLHEHLTDHPAWPEGSAEPLPRIPTLSAGPANAIPAPADQADADLPSLLDRLREHLARRLAPPDGSAALPPRIPTLSAGPANAIPGPADPLALDADLSSLLARLHEHLTGHPTRPEGIAESLPRIQHLSAGPASAIPGSADPLALDAEISSLLVSLRQRLARRPTLPDDNAEPLPRLPTLSAGPASAIPAPAAPLAPDADLSSLHEHLARRPPPDGSAEPLPRVQHLSALDVSSSPTPRADASSPGIHGVPPRGSPDLSPQPAAPPRPPDRLQRLRRRALERLGELRVDDAGLVLLCPFVERFFRRVGLVDERRGFVDEHAPMQAIALLSSLATGDPDPPEFVLPLAKLLCGRSPEADYELLRPLAPELLGEGERLLTAVIDHASVLRDISIEALRGAFLRRPAILSVRDCAWLLQVERRPHDVLLERFPWSWAWIKLAWMSDPLRVEW